MNTNKNIKNKKISLSGYIRVVDRDKSGHTIQVALETDNMEKFILDNTEQGNELFNYLDRRVLVSGALVAHDYIDDKLIVVNKFSVIDR